ncbi:hypothetical protein K443DRAFT_107690, partial [Laccaria amethystina LaAM-08-1]
YPQLHYMGLDYLMIPGLSYNLQSMIFSQGRLPLSHVRSCLSVQSPCASMCLGGWSLRGYVQDSNVKAVAVSVEVPENAAEDELAADWDAILD